MLPDSSLPGFIQSLPKTETHLHVEGALPYELLHDLDPKRWPAQAPFRERSYRYQSFGDFEKQLLDNAMPWFTTAERYHEAAKLMFARHVEQNVKYVETSFHLPMTQFINVPGPVLIDAIRSAAPRGLEVRVFVGMIRTDINGAIRPVIDQLHTWEHLAGVDLHSHETLPTEPGTAEVWAKLRAAGKVTKCHAGEFTGAYRVREAIEQLGVTRIQHGTRAIEDPAVMRLCVERDVTFDLCPISNVGLKVVPAMAQHPLKKFMEAGIRCTLSTDDPLCFANTVNEEYLVVSHELGLTRKDLARLARNGFEVADLTPAQKQPWLAQLDAVIAGQ